jgi:hypothetical protein
VIFCSSCCYSLDMGNAHDVQRKLMISTNIKIYSKCNEIYILHHLRLKRKEEEYSDIFGYDI